MNRETWYVLEDETVADPRDVARDDEGVLRHSDGRAVATRPDGVPRSRGVDTEAVGAQQEKTTADSKDMKPEKPKRGYRTRETKAE